MAVVINEFEVLTEPAPAPAAEQRSAPALPAAPPTPRDIERALERQVARCERLRAH
jgi:hypothetical protein